MPPRDASRGGRGRARVGVRVHEAPRLAGQVIGRWPLLYTGGADASLDRPAHVRAGSALVRLGRGQLAVVQDDASFVAIIELAREGGRGHGHERAVRVSDVCLPAADGVRQFDEGRGNKAGKLDLEAALVVEDGATLVAFGSGSSEARRRIVMIHGPAGPRPHVVVVEAHALYDAMQADPRFAGSELNVEGAALAGEDVLLLQRGNGAPSHGRTPVDATARVDRRGLLAYLDGLARDPATAPPCPPLRDVVSWDLGTMDGVRLTFTDGVAAGGRWTGFLACAEASPDATRDGPVSGVALGRLDDRAGLAELAAITDERGAPLLDKTEGLCFDEEDARRAWLVVDRDDPAAPAELLELRLGEGWTT